MNQERRFPDFSLPSNGVIVNSNLKFNNPQTTTNIIRCNYNSLTDVKPIINNHSLNFKQIDNRENFGDTTRETLPAANEITNWNKSLWYSNLDIDLNYNNKLYHSTNANSPIGPYFAQGLGNYPNSTLKEY